MNCKAGDLVVIVRTEDPQFIDAIGRIFRVIRCFADNENGWLWRVESGATFRGSPVLAIRDNCARPVRDQDGEDETPSWLDVPSQSKMSS